MLTAIGTAVVIEKEDKPNLSSSTNEKFENVGVERINNLRQRKNIIERANEGSLDYNEEIWNFITSNQVYEVFPLVIRYYAVTIRDFGIMQEAYNLFNKNFISYVDSLEENKKIILLYDQIEAEKNIQVALYLSKVIKELNLFDFERNMSLLNNSDIQKQKIGLRIAMYDKLFYDKKDVENLEKVKSFIISNFKERGEKTTKKQLLSSKEKEVWVCECSKTNDIGEKYCSSCQNDIFGFKQNEKTPSEIVEYIDEKIDLIKEYLE
jgi:hypothetical protein